MTDEEQRRLLGLEKTIRNFKLVVNGTDQLSGGFGELSPVNDPLERLANIEKAFQNFDIVGGLGVNVEGSIRKGYCVTVDKLTICGQAAVTPIPPATGACCLDDGTCIVTNNNTCISLGGTYQGDSTDCEPNPCPQPTGACCIGTDCSIHTESDCTDLGGVYQGDGTDCDPNPCGQGACCIGSVCSIDTETHCVQIGGTYQGDGTTCTPNPCPETGACCHLDNSCTITTQEGCDGTFMGVGSTCEADTCITGPCCHSYPGFLGIGYYRTLYTLNEVHGTYHCDDVDCFVDFVEETISTWTLDCSDNTQEILQCFINQGCEPGGESTCNPCINGLCVLPEWATCDTTTVDYLDNTTKEFRAHRDFNDFPLPGCTGHVECTTTLQLSDRQC